MKTLKISEIFHSVQGEGRYIGYPALFIRLAGCNLSCPWCDTDYSLKQTKTVEEVAQIINSANENIVIWTGGEPTLQLERILETIALTHTKQHHMETNGIIPVPVGFFSYVCFSPKEYSEQVLRNIAMYMGEKDVKVVFGSSDERLYEIATILMPLTPAPYTKEDAETVRKTLEYCQKHNKRFSPRLQIIYGLK